MKRLVDLLIASLALVTLLVPIAGIALAVRMTSPGPVLYWSERVGRRSRSFLMPKFRTMRIDTPEVATHLLENPDRYITGVGRFLRSTSLDEVPQLWSILVGHMSFVGPRPALHNQHDLIALRNEHGIDELRPGLTGWAQVNGRDELTTERKVELDREYAKRRSLALDARILLLTLLKTARRHGVRH